VIHQLLGVGADAGVHIGLIQVVHADFVLRVGGEHKGDVLAHHAAAADQDIFDIHG
jgi:hypothetical protein